MKYLRLIPALLLGAMLTACNTTKKLYEAQQYDEVIQRVAPDICAGDMNAKHINYVAASYHKANQADHERIQALKATGQPDAWPEIYQRYCSMKGRNEALACFPKKVKQGMNYVPLDLDDDMMAARNKAESFLVAKIEQLLASGTKEDGLEANKYLAQLARTNKNNPNIPRYLMRTFLCFGDAVMLGYGNSSDYNLPQEFKPTVLAFDEGELPTYNEFHTERDRKLFYMYTVASEVEEVKISPVKLDEVTFKETNGGKTVEVTDHSQNKSVTVKGSIICFCSSCSLYSEMYSVPFEVTSTFKNDYTTIKGDREACSAETLSRLNSQPVPVPTDESMLLDAAKKLNDLIAAELRK
ncbi:MAG: hypothetical protein IJ057_05135 [Bacteroidales bacterium]|nr:hypothetical protein [Bacteroidales bacterium]